MEEWTLTWSNFRELDILTVMTLPELPGVYRLSYQHRNGERYVFYVGQAENLRQRITAHLLSSESNTIIKRYLSMYRCFVRYARVSNSNIRNGAELFLYRHYNPPCNLIVPTGPDIKINTE